MILVDTSVWVLHFRKGDARLGSLLNEAGVACHPFILGELACGNLANRTEILSLLRALPKADVVEHEEVMRFIEDRRLMGKGLGYVDMHLLASATLTDIPLWTLDKRLADASKALEISY